ncbi:PAS domain S-box-containing protein [Paenibacillus harenae]|uniref:histidine kinase n=2 Tax=Paenibacillus harenae TaxID=306543 RepID=A0ABT9U4V6_PAEHA|nr:PAS domain S-box-containing protein [Paenibacillus harenae]
MKKMSLRTKGLILIILISLFPLLVAGIGNYSAVKKSMTESAIEQASSQQSIQANDLSSWMAIRKAEVLVMSRTDAVRFGKDDTRLTYFQRELIRSGFVYYAMGYADKDGNVLRTDGERRDIDKEPFFQDAIRGQVVITDPYTPSFSSLKQFLIVVPVYGPQNEVQGVVYASILFSAIDKFLEKNIDQSVLYLYTDNGSMIFNSVSGVMENVSLYDDGMSLKPFAEKLTTIDQGYVKISEQSGRHALFYTKVDGTPWRLALKEPISKLEAMLNPIFWRIFITIAISEAIIALTFYLYFEGIIKRLERILAVTEQAASGDFESNHLATTPNDEIGQLAHSVNGMMEHLQEMFDRLEAIINQNQYAFIVLDDQYRVSYLNKTAEEMLGYTTEELSGWATPLLFMDMEEIDREAERLTERLGREVQPGLEVFKELRNEKFSYEREWTFIHKDGTRIPTVHSSNGLRDRNGRFSGVVGMVSNITERKQVEKSRNRLLEIVESAKDLIASVDMEGKVIYLNGAGKEMLGIESEHGHSELVEQHVQPGMYGELVRGAKFAEKRGFWESGAQLLRKDGELLHVSMVVVAHQDMWTGEKFFSCIARDISEQIHVQDELIRAREEAEEANQSKSRFLALMSHEIRTPLNGIVGLTHLMRKTGLSSSQKDYMDKMQTSSETLLRIINDILDFSKIEAGKIEVERLPFQPDELLSRLTDQLSVFMGGKEQFEFIIESSERMPQTVIGDAMRLEQVLLNLCINAIKFTSKGRVKLQVEQMESNGESARIRFDISDTGIGMTKEQLDKLFKPFTQADGSTTRKFGGTGLGLVISKSFVELMGGKLKVESVPAVGSRFNFTLSFPIIHSYAQHAWQLDADMAEQPVWIVEDDAEMRSHWSGMMEAFGMAPVSFDSWKNAKERLMRTGAGTLPKLIILDMEMPDMYGVETWLEFHRVAEARGVRTIAMTTSYGRDEMLQLPDSQRPVTLLIKPLTRISLQRALSGLEEKADADLRLMASGKEVAAASSAARVGKARILLAEDNKINQLVALEILKASGYEAGLAENGQEALNKLEEEHWDLVLIDIHMPVMDGSEAVRIIREQPRFDKLPIIAVTANALRQDHERYLKMGMNGVVTKPIDAERLQNVITYWLAQGGKDKLLSPALWEDGAIEAESGKQGQEKAELVLPQIEGMDVPGALARVNGKLPIFIHMLEQFRRDYLSFCDQLRLTVLQEELSMAKRMVHTLKGAAGYLSAAELSASAAEVDRILKESEPDTVILHASIHKLNKELTTLLEGLKDVPALFDNKS